MLKGAIRSAMPRRQARRGLAITVAVLVSIAMSVFGTTPATAAGKPYSPTSWAGYRVHDVRDNWGNYPDPRSVKATWKVPCLPTAADGVYGAYDQWLGITDTAGTSFIQAGVRSYHLDIGYGVMTGYFAWILNSRDPGARTPVQVFTIHNCGPQGEDATVHAEVNANGNVLIYADNWGFQGEPRRLATRSGYPMPNPGFGDFILERFSQDQYIPQFGTAGFLDAWVGSDANHGWSLGSPYEYLDKQAFNMSSLNPRPPWLPPGIAVATTQTGPNGNFELRQWALK